ncbi:MAG TPA: hypothetical protein VNY83_04600 [Solirubrobacterales bacterium]|jgi:hypothetical protein|nr:hypothetical protein [Solirubrobacterales bacterium]
MALEGVPPYLVELLRKTDPEGLRRFVETGEGLTAGDIDELRNLLSQWAGDEDFWNALGASPSAAPQDTSLDGVLEQELEVLTEALGGDRGLAERVLLELPAQIRAERPDVDQVPPLIIVIKQELPGVEPGAPPSQRLRVARVLRRVFKAAVGGVSIAADITVLPDPTLLVRAVSIAAGVDLIVDAVAPQLLA